MSPLGCHKADSPLPANQIKTLHRANALPDGRPIHLHTTAKLENSDLGLHNITSLLNTLSGVGVINYQSAGNYAYFPELYLSHEFDLPSNI